MAVYKLHVDEFDDLDYKLIAIHSPLEDYRLAYFINQNLPITLKKNNCNIIVRDKNGETQFTRFIFEDEKRDIFWNLVQNQNEIAVSSPNNPQDLFAGSNSNFSTKTYLIPEYKNVDYFLKIENPDDIADVPTLVNLIKKINKVTAVYPVEAEKIKSKTNLIF